MKKMNKDFSHVPNFTGYMAKVVDQIKSENSNLRIIDIPAGNGLFADFLRQIGHSVVTSDINRERPDYIFANLDEHLPFPDAEFDIVTCMEGIEHTMNPTATISELVRISKPGGKIIVTLPNIQNVYSRLKFFLTGSFYMFEPWSNVQIRAGELKDRGHISPMTYSQLRYHFEFNGCCVEKVLSDKWKKKWIFPFLIIPLAVGWLWSIMEIRHIHFKKRSRSKSILKDIFSPPTLFGRSIILVFRKNQI